MKDDIGLQNGAEVVGAIGWCDLCNISFGGSMTMRKAKYLDGKFYHPECYPTAVNIYLADKRLNLQRDKQMSKDANEMPFTRHSAKDLSGLLDWFKDNPLPVECLDAFLYEYKRTGDLDKAVFFARCEWDC